MSWTFARNPNPGPFFQAQDPTAMIDQSVAPAAAETRSTACSSDGTGSSHHLLLNHRCPALLWGQATRDISADSQTKPCTCAGKGPPSEGRFRCSHCRCSNENQCTTVSGTGAVKLSNWRTVGVEL
eukprot:234800-Rhodomonas_salina.2